MQYSYKICHYKPQLTMWACFEAYRTFRMRGLRGKFCYQIPQNGQNGHFVEFGDIKFEVISEDFLVFIYLI